MSSPARPPAAASTGVAAGFPDDLGAAAASSSFNIPKDLDTPEDQRDEALAGERF